MLRTIAPTKNKMEFAYTDGPAALDIAYMDPSNAILDGMVREVYRVSPDQRLTPELGITTYYERTPVGQQGLKMPLH